MHANRTSRRVLRGAGLALVTLIGASGCSSSPAPASPGQAPGSPAAPASAAAPAASGSPAPPAPTPSSSPAAPSGVRDLVVTPAVRASLTAAFAAHKQIPAADVAGTLPGSVYYAYDPATGTYWAMASFVPSRTAPLAVGVGFQDGGGLGMFTRSGTGAWQAANGGPPPICSMLKFFPKPVLRAWSQPTVSTGPTC